VKAHSPCRIDGTAKDNRLCSEDVGWIAWTGNLARRGAGVREFAYDMSVRLTLEHDRGVAAVGCAPRFITRWRRCAIRGAGSRREWKGPMSHRSVA